MKQLRPGLVDVVPAPANGLAASPQNRSLGYPDVETSVGDFHIWREQVLETFCSLFPSRIDTIVRPIDGTGWRSVSRFYSLSNEDIEESISGKAKLLRAVMPGNTTRFTVLTIAAGSELYDLAGLARIKAALKFVGIARSNLYKASGSDDWQIFIWWSEAVKVKQLERSFDQWLTRTGLALADSVFLFPGSRAIPLPLQPGFAWLDDRAIPVTPREALTLPQAVETFLEDMANSANHWKVISEAMKSPLEFIMDAPPIETVQDEQPDRILADEAVIEAWETLIDRVEHIAKPTGIREIAVVQPTCDTEVLTRDNCVQSTLWVRSPEVEYSLTFAPEEAISEESFDEAIDEENIAITEYRRI